jgi:hypothetical protein
MPNCATPSHPVLFAATGVKSFFLKLIDPLFRRKDSRAGAVIPIRIHGKRDEPSVGLDVGKALK